VTIVFVGASPRVPNVPQGLLCENGIVVFACARMVAIGALLASLANGRPSASTKINT
jgi:hypothetical protein